MVNVPIVGQVAAGQPILAQENIEDYFPIPIEHMPNKQTFMLKVKGESMINAGILDGDMVLVEEEQTASNGDMVVALVDDSATVKTFYKEEGVYRLQPENDAMEPILTDSVQILGKVIGHFLAKESPDKPPSRPAPSSKPIHPSAAGQAVNQENAR